MRDLHGIKECAKKKDRQGKQAAARQDGKAREGKEQGIEPGKETGDRSKGKGKK